MGLKDILATDSITTGIVSKFDRHNKFRLRRILEKDGFHSFIFENLNRKEKLVIKRFIFERFRDQLAEIAIAYQKKTLNANSVIEIKYKTNIHYKIKFQEDQLVIKDQQQNVLQFSLAAILHVKELLYSDSLEHPNEVLDRIVTYHKLFQFTFDDNSESINSDLHLRKDVLSSLEKYNPPIQKSSNPINFDLKSFEHFSKPEQIAKNKEEKKLEKGQNIQTFQSRLGERNGDKSYKVDFDKLFMANQSTLKKLSEVEGNRKSEKTSNNFLTPLISNEIKVNIQTQYKCDFSKEDIESFREDFLQDRDHEMFLGFEICEAIYKTDGGRLNCYKFPLYYMRVKISESGRSILINPVEGSKIYINHIALANLVEKFSKSSNSTQSVDEFFKNLLAQKIEIDGEQTRIYLTRFLPFDDLIFQKTREILLGMPGENGLGGLLSNLRLIGIECDLESVYLYKISKEISPVVSALEDDLHAILKYATEKSNNFNQSLLGAFLSPSYQTTGKEKFCSTPYIPGVLPKSTKTLLEKLNQNNLILLEGPPGTGKTFTIMNLLLHCICTNKKLLIVSDKKGAIHALTEKIQSYLLGKDRTSGEAKNFDLLWKSSIKVVDELPNSSDKLSKWINDLTAMLGEYQVNSNQWLEKEENWDAKIELIDKEIRSIKKAIEHQMNKYIGPHAEFRNRVTPKRMHATTVEDINHLVDFLQFMKHDSSRVNSKNIKDIVRDFIVHREMMIDNEFEKIYTYFRIPKAIEQRHIDRQITTEAYLHTLLNIKPKTLKSFQSIHKKIEANEVTHFVAKLWEKHFPTHANKFVKFFHFIRALIAYPLMSDLKKMHQFVGNQKELFLNTSSFGEGVLKQLAIIHGALSSESKEEIPLSLEICRFSTKKYDEADGSIRYSVQEYLEMIDVLYKKRDKAIKKKVISNLAKIVKKAYEKDEKDNTSLMTSIASTLDAMKNYSTLDSCQAFLTDLKKQLFDAFPVWVCRKQAVSFLFPSQASIFDLVIVDEATQCGVDDALPLLYRAKKVIVVGDEKQTVLARNSVIDDYLFNEFNLEEHLRTTQARGFKGGGSQIFSLVKGIKQAHVLLDEHYRCPPEIIKYSNHYVYHDELKTMQWQQVGQPSSVVVDYSEEHEKDTGKQESGQFKGIETKMVDRFMEYVEKTILKIEKEQGIRINLETDVAICYFLLKNEPYVKKVKSQLLTKLNRGADILDGAGAALQGKERDYIFYFWDINKGNLMAFRQGDDPDKRKGELNVLMSRPKVRAYHYLHKNFSDLPHQTATITDYLWNAYSQQNSKIKTGVFKERKKIPDQSFIPWKRSSGQLMFAILGEALNVKSKSFDKQYSVVVGDASRNIDLILSTCNAQGENISVGMVDLCSFENVEIKADDLIDYYFQLQRATPKISPVFIFMHELADNSSRSYKRIARLFDKNSSNKSGKKAS